MSRRDAIWALGAMSGTSLDGVDAAMVLTDGEEVFETGPSAYRPYTEAETSVLRAALGRWPGDDLTEARAVIHDAHADLLSRFDRAELVGFHGQTLAHEPRGLGTHQLGDGAVLAEALRRPVAWDFRSADVAAGGEGAPLAPFYHFACAKAAGEAGPVAFLNLGGVGNITWIDPSKSRPEDAGALLAFDTGPANAPINDLMMRRRGLPCDENGALAARGRVNAKTLGRMLAHPYFRRSAPKSLDRDDFSTACAAVDALGDADAAATLTAIVAASVARGLDLCPAAPSRIFVTGGGRKNPSVMEALREVLRTDVAPIEDVGFDGDMLEAQAFALLAVRVLRDLPLSAPGTTGVHTPCRGGRIARPATPAQRAVG